MKHTIIEKAALKAKSEETGIPFSNLLAGYVLEELMYLIEDSPFSLFLWLKNSGALGVEQYRKKNLLTLDFAYVTDPRAMKREGIVPGQELSLKMGYVMLAYILKVERCRTFPGKEERAREITVWIWRLRGSSRR